MDYKRTKIYVNDKLVYDKCNDDVRVNKLSLKERNKAPEEIEGDYDLSIRNNKIVLVDNKDGTTVEAKCHPDDGFDVGLGVSVAFDKMNDEREKNAKIDVGSYVEITDAGDSYATLDYDWFKQYRAMDYAVNYRYGVCPTNGQKGTIVKNADGKYLVEVKTVSYLGNSEYNNLNCHDAIYIVGHDAVRRA